MKFLIALLVGLVLYYSRTQVACAATLDERLAQLRQDRDAIDVDCDKAAKELRVQWLAIITLQFGPPRQEQAFQTCWDNYVRMSDMLRGVGPPRVNLNANILDATTALAAGDLPKATEQINFGELHARGIEGVMRGLWVMLNDLADYLGWLMDRGILPLLRELFAIAGSWEAMFGTLGGGGLLP